MQRILVLGAGYAGLTATTGLAGRLRRRDDVRITLVDAGGRFTERLRLHQVATGQHLTDLRPAELLAGTNVELVTGWVTGIDAAARTVRVDDDQELRYDLLVYALGAVADTTAVPGAGDHAYTLNSATDAALLADRLAALTAGAVVVGGSGLTGVEAAAEIAERHPHLDVLLLGGPAPGATLGPKARAHLDAALRRLGVRVRSGVRIVKAHAGSVDLDGGESVPADVLLWTAGVRVPPLAAAAGLTTDERGRIVVDRTLRSVSHPEVYAIGDAAAVPQGPGTLHGTCQSGMPTGAHAAASIARGLSGRAPRPFRFGYLHAPVSLGRHDAVVQFTRPDDAPRRAYLTGRAAVWYKETVSASPWPSWRRTLRLPRVAMLGWRRGGGYTR
ncbi:MAG: FAD-dependent oxidoreductase [Actinoplanes sp.]